MIPDKNIKTSLKDIAVNNTDLQENSYFITQYRRPDLDINILFKKLTDNKID